mmetsp:Transcript_32440/g.93071  ORF Transcript_32440/g.93071 Transcript_32440/m.93071 type:complete len:214 (-) Transcript_32440:376-1017(-)
MPASTPARTCSNASASHTLTLRSWRASLGRPLRRREASAAAASLIHSILRMPRHGPHAAVLKAFRSLALTTLRNPAHPSRVSCSARSGARRSDAAADSGLQQRLPRPCGQCSASGLWSSPRAASGARTRRRAPPARRLPATGPRRARQATAQTRARHRLAKKTPWPPCRGARSALSGRAYAPGPRGAAREVSGSSALGTCSGARPILRSCASS